MAASTEELPRDEFVLNEIAKAAELYEAYVRISEVTAALSEEPTVASAPVYDWNHPLGLVINK